MLKVDNSIKATTFFQTGKVWPLHQIVVLINSCNALYEELPLIAVWEMQLTQHTAVMQLTKDG